MYLTYSTHFCQMKNAEWFVRTFNTLYEAARNKSQTHIF